MQQDTVIPFPHPQLTAEDPFSGLTAGAQRLLAQAIEVEVAMLLAQYRPPGYPGAAGHRTERISSRARSPNGPWRRAGQSASGAGPERGWDTFSFCTASTSIRRSKSLEALLPWLYLKGVSTGDFSEALQALLGPDAQAYRRPR